MATAEENQLILDTIAFIKKTWPDIEIDDARIAGFHEEIASGDGRTADQIKADILTHIVGEEKIKAYVSAAFTERGDPVPDQARIDRITGELMGGRAFFELNETLDGLIGPRVEVKPDEPGVLQPDAKTDEYDGVMSGGTIRKVVNGSQPAYYIIEYEYPPGHKFFYRMGSLEELEAVVGPSMGGGAILIGPEITDESVLNDPKLYTDGGDANEIQGIPGSFDEYIDDITRSAAQAAGVDDPSLVGDALKDPAIALIMAKAAEGKWSKEQVKAALRGTDYYKDVLYPGIEHFYDQSNNPEVEYAMYKQTVDAAAKSLGLPVGADGSYKHVTAELLEAGVSDTAFTTFATIYVQAQTNAGFASSLSKWTEKYAGVAISSFEDYYDVLAGNSPAEILEIAEVAGLQYMADNQGFEISDEQLQTIADATSHGQAAAGQIFSQTARDLIALGERGLRRGGLTSNEILEAEAGFSSGGANIDAIKLKMNKLAHEEGISDDPTASIFTDFNREGAPIKKGLGASISEGA